MQFINLIIFNLSNTIFIIVNNVKAKEIIYSWYFFCMRSMKVLQ